MYLKQILILLFFLLYHFSAMAVELEPVDNESATIRENYRRLNANDTELNIVSSTADQKAALDAASSPSAANPVATATDVQAAIQEVRDEVAADVGENQTNIDNIRTAMWSTPEDSGAVCDGITDDTIAVNLAIASGQSLLFKNLCRVDELTFDQSDVTYRGIGGGGLLLHTAGNRIAVITGSDVIFTGMTFSGNSLNINIGLVRVEPGVTGISFRNSTFSDVIGISTMEQSVLLLQGGGTEVVVRGCLFENIQSTNTTGLPESAPCTGIHIRIQSDGDNQYDIIGNKFKNIYTNNISGNIDLSDADGIRIYSNVPREAALNIQGNSFYSVQKSAVKCHHVKGVKISGTYVYADRSEVPMVAGVRIQKGSDGAHITDTTIVGNASRCVHVQGSNMYVDGIQYYPAGWSTDVRMLTIFNAVEGVADTGIVARNFNGRKVRQVVSILDSFSQGQLQFIKGLVMENITVSPRSDAGRMTDFFNVMNVDGVTLSDITILNDTDSIDHCFLFTDTDNVTMNRITASARVDVISFVDTGATVTGNNVRISNSDFYRTTTATDLVTNFIRFRDTDGVTISDTVISSPTFDAVSNNQPLRVDAKNIDISSLHFVTRDEGGGYANTTMMILAGAENFIINGVSYDMQDTTLQLDTFVIQTQEACTNGIISGVVSNSRGIWTDNTTVNTQIENISAADPARELLVSSGADVVSIRYTATDIEGYINNAWVSLTEGNELTADELDAINGANEPSGINVMATMDDIVSVGLIDWTLPGQGSIDATNYTDGKITCYNESGSILPVGTVGYLGADTGNGPTLHLADADSISTISTPLVMTTADILNSAAGVCQLQPGVVEGLSDLTSAANYHVSSVAGEITTADLTSGYLRLTGQALSSTTFLFMDSGVFIGVNTDLIAPSMPANLVVTTTGQTSLDISWDAATDNVAVDHYVLRRDNTQIGGSHVGLAYSDSGLSAGTSYDYTIQSVDTSGNTSTESSVTTGVTTAVADTENPTIPSGVAASAVSDTRINVSWIASTDNVAVSHYLVRQDGAAPIQVSSPSISYSYTGLTAETEYSYTVEAVDTSTNSSGQSAAVLETTLLTTAGDIVFDSFAQVVTFEVLFTTGTATVHWSDSSTTDIVSDVVFNKDFGTTASRTGHYITFSNPESVTRFNANGTGHGIDNIDFSSGTLSAINYLFVYQNTEITQMNLANCPGWRQLHLNGTAPISPEEVDDWIISVDNGIIAETVTGAAAYISFARTSASNAARTNLISKGFSWTGS